jgi:hypothetical protein
MILALCGCASTGAKIDTAQLNEVRKGQTTVTEIVKRFGRPNVLSKNWDGTQTAAYANTGGGSDSGTMMPLMGAMVAGTGGVDSVIFYFDANGVLADYKSTQVAQIPANAAGPLPKDADAAASMQTSTGKPAAVRGDTAPKDGGRFSLPSWLPSEIRDTRQ